MYRSFVKRWMDFSISSLFLLFFSWVFVFIFIVSNNLPIFFRQERIGFKNRSFFMWKFRTLSQDLALPLMERTFPLGQWLRKTSLDELPQLWNVVKGDMSLIGPRPLPITYLDRFNPSQLKRHNVMPGITGLAQISGKNFLNWPDKFRYDCFYVQKVSFMLDVYIVIKTIKLVFFPYNDYSLQEEEFKGS